jgi:hypothetical protein
MESLGVAGRVARASVALVAGLLLVAGSAWGSDDDFPFGPFLMYATARDDDEPIGDTATYGVDASGRRLALDQSLTGLRRAEIEGQLARFADRPALLRHVAAAYARRNPDAPPLQRVAVVVRWHELRDGEVTGHTRDEVVARWGR